MKIIHLGKVLGITLILIVLILNYLQIRGFLSNPNRNYKIKLSKTIGKLFKLHLPLLTAMGITVIYLLVHKLNRLNDSIVTGGRLLADVKLYSPRFEDIWLLNNPDTERLIYLGYISLIGVGYAFYRLVKFALSSEEISAKSETVLISFFLFLFFLTYTLCLGLSFGDTSLYEFFFHYVPFFNYPRVPGRIAILAFLSGAILTAWSVKEITEAMTRKGMSRGPKIFGCMIFIIIILDFHPWHSTGITKLTANPVYEHIQSDIGHQNLLELPLWPGDSHQSSLYEFYVTNDQIQRINGYSPVVPRSYIETIFNPLESLNYGLLSAPQHETLKAAKVAYLTFHDDKDLFPVKVTGRPPLFSARRLMGSPYLEYITSKDQVYLFKVLDTPRNEELNPINLPLSRILDAPLIKSRSPKIEHLIDEMSNRPVLYVDPGRVPAGELTQGQFVKLPQGNYRLRMRAKIKDIKVDGKPILEPVIYEVRRHRRYPLVSRTIMPKDILSENEFRDYQLDFSLKQSGIVEIGLNYHQGAHLWITQFAIKSAAPFTPPRRYEAEYLPGEIGRTVKEKGASGNKIIEADPDNQNFQKMSLGPHVLYKAGSYEAVFRVKVTLDQTLPDTKDLNPAIWLAVTSENNRRILAQRTVYSSDTDGIRNYQNIKLEFDLDVDNELSLQVIPLSGFRVRCDYVDLFRRPESQRIVLGDSSGYPRHMAYRNYPVSELFNQIGSRSKDDQGKLMIKSPKSVGSPGFLVFGPYEVYPPGRYTVSFKLNAAPRLALRPVAILDVVTTINEEVITISKRTLWPQDFGDIGGHRDFQLAFHNVWGTPLEFRVQYLDNGKLQAHGIKTFWRELEFGQPYALEKSSGRAGSPQDRSKNDGPHKSNTYPGFKIHSKGYYRLTWRSAAFDTEKRTTLSKTTHPNLKIYDEKSHNLLQSISLPPHHQNKEEYIQFQTDFELAPGSIPAFILDYGDQRAVLVDWMRLTPLEISHGN